MDQIRKHNKKRNEKGQSIVEISLVTPLLLIALYIPFDFGLALFAAHLTQNAVREVARIAATQAPGAYNQATLQTQVTNRLPPNVTVVGTPSINMYVKTPANCMGIVSVGVTVDYTYGLYKVLRFFGATVPNTLTFTRTTEMRYEYQPFDTTNTPCTA